MPDGCPRRSTVFRLKMACSSGLAHAPVMPLCFRVEEKRDDAVNEDAVSSYRKQAGRDAEAAGDEACLADVIGRAVGQHVGQRR